MDWLCAATMEINIRFPKKLKNKKKGELNIRFSHAAFGTYLKNSKSTYHRDSSTATFIAALFTIARKWNKPRCLSAGEWKRKM